MRCLYQGFCEARNDFVVSHALELLQALCDRVLWIEDGAVRGIGPAKEIIALYREAVEDKPASAFAEIL